jgi:hypothetical protein
MSPRQLAFAALLLFAAPATAQTLCYAEYDGPIFADNVSMGGPNLLLAIRFVAPSSLTVAKIEIFTGEGTGTNSVGIWSHDGALNQPLASLGSGSWSMSNVNSWQGATMTSAIPLTGGTTYWLAWAPINGSQASVDTSIPGNGQSYMGSFSGGPWSGPFSNSNHWKFRLYGSCVTPPTTYCTAKVNGLGCVPFMSFTGTPSASASSGFLAQGNNERNLKNGLLFYGTTGQSAIPFTGGTLCVASPVRRTPGTNSGGNPLPANDCSGVYSIDMNCFAAGACGGAPFAGLKTPGTVVDCQWWGRDPGFPAPNNTSLTNALEYTVGP